MTHSDTGEVDKLTLALMWTLTFGLVTLIVGTLVWRDFLLLLEEARNLLLTWIEAFRGPAWLQRHLQFSQQQHGDCEVSSDFVVYVVSSVSLRVVVNTCCKPII